MAAELPVCPVGVIGGSGMYEMDGLEDVREVDIAMTPFGSPSAPFTIGMLHGVQVAFLARHAPGHTILPEELPSRANIYAFKLLGAKWLISVSACGSLNEAYAPGHLAVPDGLFDRTSGRAQTFFGQGAVAHVSLAQPFCPVLSKVLHAAAEEAVASTGASGKKVHMGGSVVSINGPRFSTRTESKIFQKWGLDLINMTTVPEAPLAREAEIAYAVLNHVTDYDCWKEAEKPVTVQEVIAVMTGNVAAAKASVSNAVKALAADPELASPTWGALKDGLFTRKELVPTETRKKLRLLTEKYWGPLD